MAFPTVVTRTEFATTAASDPSIPFSQVTDQLVVITLGFVSPSQTISLPAGWTNQTNHNGLIHVFWKVLDGSEGGSVTVTLSTDKKVTAFAYNINGYDPDAATPVEVSAPDFGESATPDSPNLNPSGGALDFLWLTTFVMNNTNQTDDDSWGGTQPTNYSSVLLKTTGTAGGSFVNVASGSAERLLNATSENPIGWATDLAAELWSALTIAVFPGEGGSATKDHSYLAQHIRRQQRTGILRR